MIKQPISLFLKIQNGTYSNFSRRLKICLFCQVEFSDVTKRNLKNTCSQNCMYNSMVETRHSKGSYVMTEEKKQTISNTTNNKFLPGNEEGIKIRAKISKSVKLGQTPEVRLKQSKSQKERYKKLGHWTQTEEGKARLSLKYKGFKHSEKSKENFSIAQSKRVRTKRETNYTTAHGGKRVDLNNQYFRSNWEANFVRIMNYLDKNWEYETEVFVLKSNMRYIPDFKVDGIYYELKGRMSERDLEKIELFKQLNPNLEFQLIDWIEYNKLRLQYKDLIPTWEGN